MKKVTILIPETYNDGTKVDGSLFKSFIDRLASVAGGLTIEEGIFGCYFNSQRIMQHEGTKKIWIACETNQDVAELRGIARDICKELKQECIYFDVQECEVFFLTQNST
jgi:hypothetical protein